MNIVLSDFFEKKVKHLRKKYPSIGKDILALIESLESNPLQGVPLRKGAFKIRMKISSKGKGKSGGARVITLLKIEKGVLFLLDIYDKSERESISDQELDYLINEIDE